MSANGPYLFGFIDALVRINFPSAKYLVEMHWEWYDYGADGINAWATGGGTTTLEVTYDGSGHVIESHYEPTQITYNPVAYTAPTNNAYNLTINIPSGEGVKWYNPSTSPMDQDGYEFFPVFSTADPPPVEITPPTAYSYSYGSNVSGPTAGDHSFAKFHTEAFYFSGGHFAGNDTKTPDNSIGDIKISVGNALPSVAYVVHQDGPFFPTNHQLTLVSGAAPPPPDLPPDVGHYPDLGSIKYTGNGYDYTGTSPVGRSTILRGGNVGIGFTAIVYSAKDFKYDTAQQKIVLKEAGSGAEPLSVTSTGAPDFMWQDGLASTPTDNNIESYIPPPFPSTIDTSTTVYGIVPPGFDGSFIFRLATRTIGSGDTKKTIAILWPFTPSTFLTQEPTNLPYPNYIWRLGDNANHNNWSDSIGFGTPPASVIS